MKFIFKDINFFVPELENCLPEKENNSIKSYWYLDDSNLFLDNFKEKKIADWVNINIKINVNPELNFYEKTDESSEYYNSSELNILIENGKLKSLFIKIELIENKLYNSIYNDNLFSVNYKIMSSYLKNDINSLLNLNFERFSDTETLSRIKKNVHYIRDNILNNRTQSFDFFQNGGNLNDILFEDLKIEMGSDYIFISNGNSNLNSNFAELLKLYFQYINEYINNSTKLTVSDNSVAYTNYILDINYIKWSIKNLKWLVLSPAFFGKEVLLKTTEIIKEVRKIFFDYSQKEDWININDYFHNEYFDLNFKKLNIKLNKEKKYFTYLPTKKKLFFDYITDFKSVIPSDIKLNISYDKDLKELDFKKSSNFNQDYDNSESYNSRNWLRDAAGTDDQETMNAVYWNLD
jgi:hypothetical protein